MARRRTDLPDLSDAEWAVMKVIWDDGPMALGDLYARLPEHHGWAYSTVKTLLRRLMAKGWLDARRVGNSFLYRPAVTRERAVRRAVRDFSSRVLDGLLTPFVAYYVEERDLTPEELSKLENIIRQQRAKGGTR